MVRTTHLQDQTQKFASYPSLDFQNKIYQQKAFGWIQQLEGVDRILELGCADGSFLAHLQKTLAASTSVGLDLSPQSIKIAQARGIKAQVHNFENKLPFPDQTFDLCVTLEVIEHLYDTDFFLTEIYRVLKPRGHLVLSTPNLASLPNRFKLLLGKYPKYLEYSRQGAGHIHLYTLPILQAQLVQHRFKLTQAAAPNITCPFITQPWFPLPIRNLAIKLGDFLPTLGSHLLIKAEK